MATEVLLPKLGFSMEEGSVAEWFVADGARITARTASIFIGERQIGAEMKSEPKYGTLHVIAELRVIYPVGTIIARIE